MDSLLVCRRGLAGHTGINTVLKWFPPIVVSVILLFEPVIWINRLIFTTELTLGFWTILGGPIMLTGVILTIEENKNRYFMKNQLNDV